MNVKKHNGFYTLEALIAIIVFVVGVLGVLKIQTNSTQAVSDSQYRVNAAYLAESIIGQMWIDKNNLTNYTAGTGPDYTSWLNEVKASMPGVAGQPPTITAVANTSGTLVTVTIFWKNPSSSVYSQYVTQTTIF